MNNPKVDFFQKFNDAFAAGEMETISNSVINNIRWHMVGNFRVEGKDEFLKKAEEMKDEYKREITVTNIITHGKKAVVEGTIKQTSPSGEVKNYAYCDVCTLNNFKDGKIARMTSYVLEVKE